MLTKPASKGANNIAFAAYLQLGDTTSCISLLSSTGRLPEAAMFARTYAPAAIPGIVKAWRSELESSGKPKLAALLADPEEDAELFTEGWTGSGVPDGEGSGVLVEGEDEEEESKAGPVEGLVEKVKELVVGEGEKGELGSQTTTA
jgi:coatomer subunit beta'